MTMIIKYEKNNAMFEGELFFQENDDKIVMSYITNDKMYESRGTNLFDTMKLLRRELENDNILLFCNGCAENVYPSGMMRDISSCELAYKMIIGKRAEKSDIVNIFEYDTSLKPTTVDSQDKFYNNWLKSIGV